MPEGHDVTPKPSRKKERERERQRERERKGEKDRFPSVDPPGLMAVLKKRFLLPSLTPRMYVC